MRPLLGGVLVILAVIAAGFVAQRIFGSDSDHPLSEAREAIEAMPYGVRFDQGPAGVLIGTISGRNQVIHFAVAKSLNARGVPARLRRVDRNVGGGGPFWVWDDAEVRLRHGTRHEWEDAVKISVGIEEALCRKATGDPCPI